MTQSAMKRKVLNGVGGLIKKAPHVFELPTIDDTCVGNSTTAFALSYTCTARDLVYLTSSFKWAKADSNGGTAPQYSNMLGFVMEDGVDGDFVLVALAGSIIYASTAFPTFTGAPVYMSEIAGAVTETEPSGNSSASRVLGHGVNADMLYFNPAPAKNAGLATQIVLPTVAAQVIGPIDATRVSGYTTAAAYDLVILNSSNKWVKTDANTASLYNGILGMVVVGGATDVAITVALKGAFIKTAGTYTLGANQYMLEVAGTIGETLPTTGTSAQIVVAKAWTTTVLELVFSGYQVTSGA